MSAALVEGFLEARFRFHPEQATGRGYRGFDDRAPSFDAESVDRYRRAVSELRRRTDELCEPEPASDTAIDLASLRSELAMALFFIDDLQWLERNPLLYVEAAMESIEGLEFREDLSAESRREATRRRLLGIVPLMRQLEAQAREPLAPFHAAALEMLPAAIAELGERFERDGRDRVMSEASAKARRALDDAMAHLERCRPDVRPFDPMGEEAYGYLLEMEHHLDRDPSSLIDLARATLERVEAELPLAYRAEAALPPLTAPADFAWRDVLAYYREEIDSVRNYVEQADLVTIPPGRLELRETPAYLLPVLPGASYQPPPAFLAGDVGHFFVRPVPREMESEERARYFEQVHRRRFRNLVVHEVYPGHHVQFLHAARHPSPIRKVRDNDVMVEGWALYCEHLMHEQGIWDELPSPRPLQALRMRALRVEVDVGIHLGTLSLAAAVDFMVTHLGEGARPWVEGEVRRYAAEPTQAMSYLAGLDQVLELRDEYRDACGPRYRLREFHDRFLGEGSIPIPLIRAKLLAAT